jgi:tetratricopeptide (TPR) repeat protein
MNASKILRLRFGEQKLRRGIRAELRLLAFALALWLGCFFCKLGLAQLSSGGQVPQPLYYSGLELMHEGEFRDALQMFDTCYRSAMKFGTRRFMDSVCYLAMMGECYYQMGQLDRAFESYSAALEIALSYPTWLQQVILPPTGASPLSSANRPIPWGQRTRTNPVGQVPSTGLYTYSQIIVDPSLLERGAIVPQEARAINVVEIIRCTALALRRRIELLGPLSLADPLSKPASSVFSVQYTQPNHWSQCWGDLLAGLSAVSEGRLDAAIPLLTRSTTVAGRFEHQLSGIALIELGKLALARGDYGAAINFFQEASYDAFYYGDGLMLEEALRLAAVAHLVGRSQTVYPVLPAALAWAKTKRIPFIQASLDLSLAEQALATNNLAMASTALDDAQSIVSRRQMSTGRLATRLAFLRAASLLQSGATAQGQAALNAALPAMRSTSLWLFQISRLSQVYASGQIGLRGPITPRTAHELYQLLLRDPTNLDWAIDPLECLAVISTPHPTLYDQWFAIAWQRKQWEDALEIADRARRHRFQSALPLGGRLDALRRLLEAPEVLLDNQARQERQNLLARYPQFAELSKQSRQLRQELLTTSLVPKNNEEQVALQKKWDAWMEIIRKQESLLRAMAVDRTAVGVPFPPVIPTKQIRQQLPPGAVLWTFFAAGNDVFVFYVTNDQYDTWQLRGGQVAVQKLLSQYLTQLGFLDGNREFTVKDVAETGWQSAGANLLNFLVAGSKADLAADFDQLIIVPDGFLWYLPFETLCVKADNGYFPLVAKHKIYYAISSSSAVMGGPITLPPQPRTLVFQGRLNPQEEPAAGQQRVAAILESLPGALVLGASPSAPPGHLVASLFDQLVVLEDLGDCARPFNITPLPLAKGNTELGDWLELPYGRPLMVALPGLHMATESALRKNDISLGGQEVFLAAASLQAVGSQTLLLGRWRTGGQSLNTLLKEFFQEWPGKSASESLQRAMLLVMTEPLDPRREPRVQVRPNDLPTKTAHPLFWANLLLVDGGQGRSTAVEPAAPGGNNPPAPAQENQARENQPAAAPEAQPHQEQANPPDNANKDQ